MSLGNPSIMFKIGSYIINETAIAYINLNAKKRNSKQDIEGVEIRFFAPNHIDYVGGECGTVPDYLFFTGNDAAAIRNYYDQVLLTINLNIL